MNVAVALGHSSDEDVDPICIGESNNRLHPQIPSARTTVSLPSFLAVVIDPFSASAALDL